MSSPSLHGLNGPRHSPYTRKTKAYGEIRLHFQYVKLSEEVDEPAMVLWAQGRRSAYIICLSSAYRYVGSDGYPTKHLVKQSLFAADLLGLGGSRSSARRITDVILDNMDELLIMPPRPRLRDPKVIGEGVLTTGDGKRFEFEMNDDG